MEYKFEFPFNEFDIVELKTDKEKLPRIITGFSIRTNYVTCELSCGTTTSWHKQEEIQKQNDEKQIGFSKK